MKVKKGSGRGTSIHDEDDKPQNWAGDPYREYQKKKMESIGKDTKITMGRGTGSVKAGEYPKAPEKPSTKGYTISTGRGTGKRKIE